MNYIFSHNCFPRVPRFVLEYRQHFVEERLKALDQSEFFIGAYVQVGNPVRADQEYMFHVTDIDEENELIYLDWGGVIDTIRF